MLYRTYRSSSKGNTRVNTPGMVLYVPYVQNTNVKCFAHEVGVNVAAVAFLAGNRLLVLTARGVRQSEVLVFVVLVF